MARSFAAALAIIAAFFVACGGDDPGGPTRIQVEGQVISARSRATIAGASVSIGNLLSQDFVTTSTGDDGRFAATVEYHVCEGVRILVDHPGFVQASPAPDVCPGSPRTIELQPEPVSSVITPQDPTVAVGGTVDFQLEVTFADGTAEENGAAAWLIAADADIQDPAVCGTVPDGIAAAGATYAAPAAPPPAGCGGSAGQAAVVAAPEGAFGGSLDASDTVLVTVTP